MPRKNYINSGKMDPVLKRALIKENFYEFGYFCACLLELETLQQHFEMYISFEKYVTKFKIRMKLGFGFLKNYASKLLDFTLSPQVFFSLVLLP